MAGSRRKGATGPAPKPITTRGLHVWWPSAMPVHHPSRSWIGERMELIERMPARAGPDRGCAVRGRVGGREPGCM